MCMSQSLCATQRLSYTYTTCVHTICQDTQVLSGLCRCHIVIDVTNSCVCSTWNKMSGGKAAFRNQQPSPASATVPAEMPNAFVPLVPQDCGKVCTRADQPVHQTLSSNEQLSNRTSIPSSAASLSTGFSNSLLSGSADPAGALTPV